jgi:hypothetical protein
MITVLLFGALFILIVILYLRQDTLFTKIETLNKELNYQVGKMLDHNTKILDIVECQTKSITLLKNEIFGSKEQSLEEKYKDTKFTDPTAQKLWNFLKNYIRDDKIPVYRIEDALNMINADKIEYTTA